MKNACPATCKGYDEGSPDFVRATVAVERGSNRVRTTGRWEGVGFGEVNAAAIFSALGGRVM